MEKQYTIGEVSTRCNVPIKTLRYYDEIGLLRPEYRNADTNYRYYTDRQMTTLSVIRRFRTLDFSLKDIKLLIDNSSLKTLEGKLTQRTKDIAAQMRLLEVKKDACEAFLERIHKSLDITAQAAAQEVAGAADAEAPKEDFDIRKEEFPAQIMYSTKKLMRQYNNADVSLERWVSIYEDCMSSGIHILSPVITTYHCEPLEQFLMKDCEVEFGVLIDEDDPSGAGLEPSHLHTWGGFSAATGYHIGAYSDVMRTYVRILRWIHRNGYEVCGPASDSFMISPLDFDNEDMHVTKIIIPIR